MPGLPTLETKRLVLRPFTEEDAGDVQRLAGDATVADTTLNIPHPYEDGMAEEWIRGHVPGFEKGESAIWAVTLRETGEVVGAIGLDRLPRFVNAEVGYWIGLPFWRRGYATEALRAVLAYAFEGLELHRIHAHHFARNPASGRVMQKADMQLEGVHREHAKKDDHFEDIVVYGILRAEWEADQAERNAPAGDR